MRRVAGRFANARLRLLKAVQTKQVSEFFNIFYVEEKPSVLRWPAWVMRKVSNDWSVPCAVQIIHIKVETHKNSDHNLNHWNILLTSGGREGDQWWHWHWPARLLSSMSSRSFLIFYKWDVWPRARSCQNVHQLPHSKYDFEDQQPQRTPDGSGAHQTGPAPRLLMGLTLYWYGEIWSVSYNLIFTVGDTSHALPPPSEGSRHVMRT